MRHLEELAARNVAHGSRALVPRRRDLRPLRPRRRRRDALARRVPDRVHAVPAGDEPGRAPGDLRVPDGDLRADGDGRLERLGLRRHDGRRRRLLHREARDRPDEGRARRGAQPPGAPGREDVCAGLRPGGRRGSAPGRHDRPRRVAHACADAAIAIFQQPNFFGCLEPAPELAAAADEAQARSRSPTSTCSRSVCSRRRAPTAARWRSARARAPARSCRTAARTSASSPRGTSSSGACRGGSSARRPT